MGRAAKVWWRESCGAWYATIGGKQTNLGPDYKAAEKEFRRLKGGTSSAGRSRLTVAELCDAYLDWVRTQVKPKTFTSYAQHLNSWCAHAGSLRAVDLRPLHVTGWLAKNVPRRGKRPVPSRAKTYQGDCGWNTSTKHLAVSVVKIWSKWCKSEGYLEVNPLAEVKRPKMGTRKPVDPDTIEAVRAAAICPRFRAFLDILLDVGCRPGELRTLSAATIDWDASTAVVAGKTGDRLISLTARSLEVLRSAVRAYPSGPVLRNSRGEPWTESALECVFRRASKRAGVKMTAYHSRHDLWSRAHRAGVSDLVIAKQLGHKDLKMLAKTYAHVDSEMTKDAVERAASTSNGQT